MADKTHRFCKAVEGQAVRDQQPATNLGVIPMVVGRLFLGSDPERETVYRQRWGSAKGNRIL